MIKKKHLSYFLRFILLEEIQSKQSPCKAYKLKPRHKISHQTYIGQNRNSISQFKAYELKPRHKISHQTYILTKKKLLSHTINLTTHPISHHTEVDDSE